MLTDAKKKLINECLTKSKEYPKLVFYGFIDKAGRHYATSIEFIIRESILDGARVYCKAKNGQLIL